MRRARLGLSGRTAAYYAAMRLGRSLRDRCVGADPERGLLGAQLDQLRGAWRDTTTALAQRFLFISRFASANVAIFGFVIHQGH